MQLAILANAKRISIGIACLFVCGHSAQADIRVERGKYHGLDVYITGTITDRDARTLESLSQELPFVTSLSVTLDSQGGDVFAAMKIGRIIRKYDGTTEISETCYSSCALIYIAGVIRANFNGDLGLHRPYLSSAPQSRDMIEKQVPLMLAAIKSYVAEMGITDAFYQQMVNTEPSNVIIYRDNQASEKLVPMLDPTFDEIAVANEALKFGITTSEMRKRDGDAKISCKSIDFRDYQRRVSCEQAVKWGLSQRVYLDRYSKAKTQCWFSETQEFSPEETTMRENTPAKLRTTLPFFVRARTCVQNVILGR
jgi:hypothetical protein